MRIKKTILTTIMRIKVYLLAFEALNLSKVAHEKLFSLLIDYYFVGGMPEAVDAWFNPHGDRSILERTGRVSSVHGGLIAGYERDFGKYSNKISAQQINAVFRNIPKQLAQHEAGLSVADLCRKHNCSEQSFYRWKSKFGGMEVSGLPKRLRELEHENSELKKIVAEQTLDIRMLKDVNSRKW